MLGIFQNGLLKPFWFESVWVRKKNTYPKKSSQATTTTTARATTNCAHQTTRKMQTATTRCKTQISARDADDDSEAQTQTQTQTQTTTDWSSRLFGLLTLLLLLRLLLSVCRRGILFKVTHRISVFCFMRLLLHTHILTNNTSAKWKSEKKNRLRQTTPIPFRHYQRAFSIPCS